MRRGRGAVWRSRQCVSDTVQSSRHRRFPRRNSWCPSRHRHSNSSSYHSSSVRTVPAVVDAPAGRKVARRERRPGEGRRRSRRLPGWGTCTGCPRVDHRGGGGRRLRTPWRARSRSHRCSRPRDEAPAEDAVEQRGSEQVVAGQHGTRAELHIADPAARRDLLRCHSPSRACAQGASPLQASVQSMKPSPGAGATQQRVTEELHRRVQRTLTLTGQGYSLTSPFCKNGG
jgi:hypothetical protein